MKKTIALFLLLPCLFGCGWRSTPISGGSSTSALNLAGTWTIKTVSTQGQAPYGGFDGTATVSQSGVGVGVSGSTTRFDCVVWGNVTATYLQLA